jgi:glutamine amidotransferase
VIALIDYKAGNLTSVKKALATIGAEVFVPKASADLADASGIIVPGVGHFGATRALDQPWIDAILARVGEGRPLFGICLGMQWLYEGSDEAPELAGLGLLSGRCYRLGTENTVRLERDTTNNIGVRLQPDRDIKVPHVGWNSLSIDRRMSIVEGVPTDAQVYFTHSYAAPLSGETVAMTDKSGDVGLRILRNFVELVG